MWLLLSLIVIVDATYCGGERLGSVVYDDLEGGWVYAINISVVLERVKCYPDFETRVGCPSRVLTDFYGLQAIDDIITFSRVEEDMRRLGCEILHSTPGYNLTVSFNNTPSRDNNMSVTFFFNTPIVIRTAQGISLLSHTFAEVLSPNCNYLDAVSTFRLLFGTLDLGDYLPLNPYWVKELEVEGILNGTTPVGPVKWVDVKDWQSVKQYGENVTVVVKDRVHEHDNEAYQAISDAIRATSVIDWVGLEMVCHPLQEYLTAFLTARKESREYQEAYKTLKAKVAPYYFTLVELQQLVGRKVGYALDGPLLYDFFRYGETEFGAAVRNILWVNNMGGSGRGAILGGSAHFSPTLAPIFAHALRACNPTMILVQFLLPKKL